MQNKYNSTAPFIKLKNENLNKISQPKIEIHVFINMATDCRHSQAMAIIQKQNFKPPMSGLKPIAFSFWIFILKKIQKDRLS